MFKVLSCLGGEHDWRLVVLAGIVCFLASLAAISMFHRARATDGRTRVIWTITAGIATGCGIWATHFIAMLAYDPGVAIAYDVGLTVLSLIVAAAVTSAGLAVAIYGPARWAAPVGGGIVGGGVACMHYLGMWAVEFPGRVTWLPGLVAASILLGVAFGVAALAVATRTDAIRSVLVASLLLTLAIVSHHFTAMGAVVIVPDPTRVIDPLSMAPGTLAVAVAAAAFALLGMSLLGAIADRRSADRAVEAAARFHGLAEATSEAIVICDGDRIVDVNSSLERLVGRSARDLAGQPIRSLFADGLALAHRDGRMQEVELRNRLGQSIECEARTRTIPHGGGERTVLSLRDLREHKKAEARIHHLALHDPLTDLPNRANYNEHLAFMLEAAARSDHGFSVLCVDLDRFKEVNDVFGHLVGDALLKEVAARMRQAADGVFLARLGGDEFSLIVADGPQPATAGGIAERLLAAVAGDILVAGQTLRIGLSIGVAVYPTDGEDVETLLVNADAALYRAKTDGRGTIRFFEAEMDTRLRERRSLQHDLRQALVRGELKLHYQPLASMDGEIVAFEALARWVHPTRGLVPPATFIPLAEENGLIIPIGEWVMREACREAASWQRPLQIAVNLSPIQFRHGDLAGLVHSVLLDSGLSPRRLELEITEGVLIGDFSRAVSILRQLKNLGVKISMDDFGTGYSSLSYLQSFPFDKIKIDGSFIANVGRGTQSAAIIRAVIGLGRGLELPVVAEGVETEEQFAFLSRENCNQVQGFLVGEPRPIGDYAETVGREVEPRKITAAAG